MNTRPQTLFLPALATAALALFTLPALAQDAARQLTPVQSELAAAAPAEAAIQLDLWLDRPDGLYLEGEAVTLHLRSDTDAWITIINVDAEGNTTVIFPNRYTTEHRLAANTTAQVPAPGAEWKLRVSPPFGSNLVKVIARSSPEPLLPETSLRAAGAFSEVIGGARTLQRQLSVVPSEEPGISWGMTERVFGVVDHRPGDAATAEGTAQPGAEATTGVTIELPPSDFNLALDIDRESFAPGESIQLRATADKSCSLVLIDVLADGSYKVLLPNAAIDEVWLDGGKTQSITGATSDYQLLANLSGPHTLVGMCAARRSLGQFLFGKSARTQVVASTLSLEEVLAKQPKGDVANATRAYLVR